MKNILKKTLSIKIRYIFFLIFLIRDSVFMAETKLILKKDVEYHDILCDQFSYSKFYKMEVSYKEFIDDCKNLIYLLETAYAGFDDMCKRGFNSEIFLKNCENHFQNKEAINVSEISEYYYTYLKKYINDTHCFIESTNFRKNFITSRSIFYSDLYVSKKNEDFFVYKSDNIDFSLNSKINIPKEYLFLYPSKEKNIYRVGTLADSLSSIENICLYLDGNKYELKCKRNLTERQQSIEDFINYIELETEKTAYISIKTFIDLPKETGYRDIFDKIYLDFAESGKKYRTKQNVILDLRKNGGGHSTYPSNFLNNLVSDKKIKDFDSFDSEFLMSPAIYQVMQTILKTTYSRNDLIYKEYSEFMNLYQKKYKNKFLSININGRKNLKSEFKGKLIILIDKGTASSSELIISYAKELFRKSNQLILLGENSLGCFNYGNIFHYQLLNSGISISLAQFKMGNPPVIEGIGYFPDYWATDEDIIPAIVNITEDKELFETLKGI